MGRVEQYLEGRVPLHTMRADIDYAQATAFTIQGTAGVKVWIFHGEVLGKPDLSPNATAQRQQNAAPPCPSVAAVTWRADARRNAVAEAAAEADEGAVVAPAAVAGRGSRRAHPLRAPARFRIRPTLPC